MIKVLAKVDAILGLLSAPGGMGFGELREATGLNKATLSQLLKTMVALGWVARDAAGTCRAGERLLAVARGELARESLRGAAQAAVARLAAATGETATVAALVGARRVRLAKLLGSGELPADDDAPAGSDGGLLATATGRLLLAYQAPAERRRLLQAAGIAPRPELAAELAAIRRTGLAEYRSPNGHVRSFARGIFAADGSLLAAIGVVLPDRHANVRKTRALLAEIAAAAEFAEKIVAL